MGRSTQPSPRAAVVLGVVVALCGVPPILGGLGMIPIVPAEGTPAWVAVAGGLVFVLGGAGLIVGYVPGTRFGVRVMQYLLGLGTVGLLTAITGWIAFGPGRRPFSTRMTLPFLSGRWATGQASGRAIFGAAAILMCAFLIAMAIVGARRLRAHSHDGSKRKPNSEPGSARV